MFKNYLKSAVRNLLKYKGHSLINIIGLAIGIASCILITEYVRHEMSYDRFYPHAGRIARISMSLTVNGNLDKSAGVEFPIAPLLRQFPEVKEVARITNLSKFVVGRMLTIRYGDKSFNEERFYFADSTLLNVLRMPLALGDPQQALLHPNSVVISRDIARKYFGDEPPLGKVMRFNNMVDLKVTGVMEPFPGPSHIDADFLASMATLHQTGLPRPNVNFPQNWILNWFYTYVLLESPQAAAALEQKLEAFAQRNYPEIHRQNKVKLYVLPIQDIHLHSDFSPEITTPSDIRYVYVFGIIGGLVLAIACVNFINLTTAQFTQRLRELGVRKVLGAFRRQLITQLLTEAMLLTALGSMCAWFLIELSLPLFHNLTGIEVHTLGLWPYIVLPVPFLGAVAGVYPAMVFSSFEPTAALKDSTRSFAKGAGLRKVLVVLQFSISIILIIGTLVVREQLQFMKNKDTGFDRHQVLMIPIRGSRVESQFETFKNRLLQNSNIIQVSGVNTRLGKDIGYTTFQVEGLATTQILSVCRVEYDFVKTLGLHMVEGRDFTKDIPTDATHGFIINESAKRQFGWSEAIGKTMRLATVDGAPQGTVVGVVKDFHFLSMHKDIGPLVILQGFFGYASIKVREHEMQKTLAFVETVWKELEPDKSFSNTFLDDMLVQNYQTEDQVGHLTSYFSGLAIFIACLGLLGLTSFTTARRTKEVGVRKILGATTPGLMGLLSREFIALVVIANLLAWPVAYLAMQRWLDNFAYRISLDAGVFLVAGGLALAVAVLTVCYHTVRAAMSNPVESLRYE